MLTEYAVRISCADIMASLRKALIEDRKPNRFSTQFRPNLVKIRKTAVRAKLPLLKVNDLKPLATCGSHELKYRLSDEAEFIYTSIKNQTGFCTILTKNGYLRSTL